MSMDKPKGIFDVEIDLSDLPEHSSLDDYFTLQELKQRKFFITDEIDQSVAEHIARFVMWYNKEDADIAPSERQPIFIYISSPGGSVDAGFEIIDVIQMSKTPVYTVNIGYAYSMGFLIMLAGHKRYAMPNSKFLLHDGANGVWDSGAKAQDRMEFDRRVEQRIRDYILGYTTISPEEYHEKFRVEWYMFANEAKGKGVIDYIIGEDAMMDDVI